MPDVPNNDQQPTAVDQALRDKFFALLEEACEKELETTITNRFPWQTEMATVRLLGYAKKLATQKIGEEVKVRILSGTAPDGFYGKTDVVNGLQECVDSGCSVEVLVWNNFEHRISPSLADLAEKNPGKLTVRLSGTRENGREIPHFLLVQNRVQKEEDQKNAFRFELSHDYFDGVTFTDDQPQTKASICFNDRGTGKSLASFFDSLWAAVPTQ